MNAIGKNTSLRLSMRVLFVLIAGYVSLATHHALAQEVELSRSAWSVMASNTVVMPQGYERTPAGNAIDENSVSRWSSRKAQEANMWFEVDLGRPQSFSQLTLKAWVNPTEDQPRNPNNFVKALDFAKSFDIRVSATSLSDDEWAALEPVSRGENKMTSSEAKAAHRNGETIDPNTRIDFDYEQQGIQFIRIYLTDHDPENHYWWSISDIRIKGYTPEANW